MGLWGTGKRRGLDHKLKEYDHSVGFTLNTNDQFTLQVPNGSNSKDDLEERLLGVHVPHKQHDEVISTVSSITTTSTDGSLTASSVSTCSSSSFEEEGDQKQVTAEERRIRIRQAEKETCLSSFFMDLCGYGDAAVEDDWCPACTDVQPTPSVTSEDEFDVFAPPTRDEDEVQAVACCGWGSSASPTRQTLDKQDNKNNDTGPAVACCGWGSTPPQQDENAQDNKNDDKYAVDKKLHKAERKQQRKQRRKSKKARKRSKRTKEQAQCNVEVVPDVNSEPIQQKKKKTFQKTRSLEKARKKNVFRSFCKRKKSNALPAQ